MKPRPREYLQAAETRLGSAKTLAADDPSTALSTAYYAAVCVSRRAERARHLTPHAPGAWHEFREQFVANAQLDADLAAAMQRLQTLREQADYDAAEIPVNDAHAAIGAVETFIAAVADALG